MPGIVGIVNCDRGMRRDSEVADMLAVTRHDPSYVSGMHAWPEMGIYCGWMAHENSFAAEQIFQSREKDVALVLSGECFLDSETQALLQRRGYTVEPENGTWLIALYLEIGDRFFEHLNGLFSGLLVDQRSGKGFLFNDRYGLERIYWHETKEAFYFASEAKSLLRILPALREFDWDGVAQFLNFGCNVGERTLFRGVHLAAGGSLWSFASGLPQQRQYFRAEDWETQAALSPADFNDEFEAAFKRILPRYFQGKAKTGISLTAGLDSRMIMACLPNLEPPPVSYTFSGIRGQTLDDRLAARVAQECQIEHQLIRIEADFFTDFQRHADETAYVTDGCFGILGAHEIYLNHKARRLAPIRVTGNFGSEVLRGTTTFKGVGLSDKLLNPEIVGTTTSNGVRPAGHPVTFAAFHEIPYSLFGSLAAGRSQTMFRTPYLDNEIVAMAYKLPVSLRRSSKPALDLIRANKPTLAAIPTDMGLNAINHSLGSLVRHIFAKATFKLDYFNNEGLPQRLAAFDPLVRNLRRVGMVGLHKYLHYRSWFRKELSNYVHDALQETLSRRSPLWNIHSLEGIRREWAAGRISTAEIGAVLTLDSVERLLLRPCSQLETANSSIPQWSETV